MRFIPTFMTCTALVAAGLPSTFAQPGAEAPPPAAVAGDATKTEADSLAVAAGGPAQGKRDARLEVVALFPGIQMPTGVTVSSQGRIFVTFPRWNDPVAYTVAELKDGQITPFPDAATHEFRFGESDPRQKLISVQSAVVDGKDRLWLLDPGSINLAPVVDGGPKLWAYDLATRQRVKQIGFPRDVALKRTYLNDVRFDLGRGSEGTAYITDSGAGGIIVVDLASGDSWRHLDSHPSVKSTPGLRQVSEGQPLLLRKPSGEVAMPDIRSDGIALSPDGETLYYTPLTSRDVYAVPTDLLADRKAHPEAVADAVKKIATKPSGNDGLICDAAGGIYTTDYEDNAIRRIDPSSGEARVIVQDERLIWPDTLSFHGNHLYILNNQLPRQPNFHYGKDQRKPPYALFRIKTDQQAKTGPTR